MERDPDNIPLSRTDRKYLRKKGRVPRRKITPGILRGPVRWKRSDNAYYWATGGPDHGGRSPIEKTEPGKPRGPVRYTKESREYTAKTNRSPVDEIIPGKIRGLLPWTRSDSKYWIRYRRDPRNGRNP